jgi:hypothetical protein
MIFVVKEPLKIIYVLPAHELSAIILNLYELNLLSNNIFNILFPSFFVMGRFIIFNYYFWKINHIKVFTIIPYIMLNLLNIGITKSIIDSYN